MRIVSTGAVPERYSVHTIAAYDRTDGRVLNTHHVVVFEGAEMPELTEIEEDVMKTAEATGIDRSKIAVLDAGTKIRDFNAQYRVDLKRQSLVKVRMPQQLTKQVRSSR
jgi:hypothetical protein